MKIFFVIFAFCVVVNCIELECEFEGDYGCDGCLGYYCRVSTHDLVTNELDREITSLKVKGQHEEGKSNDDVTGIYAVSKVVNFIPRNITKFFKNINNLSIYHSNLQKISKEDLKEFSENLKVLWLIYNKIEVIDADTFEYNKNLESINFSFNKIKRISDGAFGGLEKLRRLWVTNNPCTDNEDGANERLEVMKLVKRIEGKCKF